MSVVDAPVPLELGKTRNRGSSSKPKVSPSFGLSLVVEAGAATLSALSVGAKQRNVCYSPYSFSPLLTSSHPHLFTSSHPQFPPLPLSPPDPPLFHLSRHLTHLTSHIFTSFISTPHITSSSAQLQPFQSSTKPSLRTPVSPNPPLCYSLLEASINHHCT
jgi:hypothetical protein